MKGGAVLDRFAVVPLVCDHNQRPYEFESGLKSDIPRSVTERRRLVHVQPYSRVLDAEVRPVLQGLVPILLNMLREEVWEDGVSGPDLTNVLCPIWILDKDIAMCSK